MKVLIRLQKTRWIITCVCKGLITECEKKTQKAVTHVCLWTRLHVGGVVILKGVNGILQKDLFLEDDNFQCP